MITTIQNQQTNHPLNLPQLQKLTDWLALQTEAATAPDAWEEVCLILVNNEGITAPNREYFGKDRPTDVISFRYDPIPGEAEAWSGDLIVNVDRAVQEGTERGDIPFELALYIAHGFDHLTGAEDNTPEKREQMLATETAWLTAATKAGLLENLFE